MIKNRTAILALLTGLNLLNYMDRYVLSAVLIHVEPELGLSKLEAGLAASTFLLGYFLTAPFFGARADRGARKHLIAAGVLVWSIATVLTGFATSAATLLAARALVGVGEAAYATLAPTIIDDLTPPESKGKALAVFYVAMPVGSALGYILGGTIDHHFGWRYAFFFAGGPGAVIAAVVLLIDEPKRKLAAVKTSFLASVRVLARIPIFRRAVIGYCAYTWAVGGFSFWAPEVLIHRYPGALNTQNANFWFGSVTVVAGAIGTVLGGRLADRAQHKHAVPADAAHDAPVTRRVMNDLLRICSIGMLIATPLVALCFFMPVPIAFFAIAFVVEIGVFLSTSPVAAVGLQAVPTELRASSMAVMIFAIHLFGDLWSPAALGGMQDGFRALLGASKEAIAPQLLGMAAIPLMFGLAAYWWWPRSREAK